MSKAKRQGADGILDNIGYNPISRTYYIDRDINGVTYCLYSFSKDRVTKYIISKHRNMTKRRVTAWN